jgi:hypothetical protein
MNAIEYKFIVVVRNLFGCSSKDSPVSRRRYLDCYSLAVAFYLFYQGYKNGTVSLLKPWVNDFAFGYRGMFQKCFIGR